MVKCSKINLLESGKDQFILHRRSVSIYLNIELVYTDHSPRYSIGMCSIEYNLSNPIGSSGRT